MAPNNPPAKSQKGRQSKQTRQPFDEYMRTPTIFWSVSLIVDCPTNYLLEYLSLSFLALGLGLAYFFLHQFAGTPPSFAVVERSGVRLNAMSLEVEVNSELVGNSELDAVALQPPTPRLGFSFFPRAPLLHRSHHPTARAFTDLLLSIPSVDGVWKIRGFL